MADVAQIFTDQQLYAASVGRTVDAFLAVLSGLSTITATVEEPAASEHTFYDAVNAFAGSLGVPGSPAFDELEVLVPDAPTIDIADVETISVPDLTVSPPPMTFPATPALSLPQSPASAPSFTAPGIPTPPELVIPLVPTLTQINLPTAPTIDLPSFSALAPAATFTPPSNNFAWAEEAYASTMLDALKAKLLADMQDGGYGIEPADETRLWDRMIERESAQASANVEEVERAYAAKRFPVPPGAMYQALERARQAAQDAASTASREIAVKRGDLFVQNRQFTIEQVKQLEGVLINFHTAKLERLLNAAKYSAQFAIDFFNAQRAAYLARLDGYRAEAAVFADLVRAQVEKLNIYRAQLEGERMKGEIDKTRLEGYRAQLAGLEMQVNVYKTRMQAAEVQAGIEKIKLDAYRASVDAYVATVKGRELEFQAYESAVRGEEAKARVYESQVRGYAVTVEGLKTRADVAATRFRTQVERANSQIALYNANNSRYRTQWEGLVDVEKLKLNRFQGEVDAYKARASATGELARLGIANYEANSRDLQAALKQNLERALLSLRVQESNRDFKLNSTSKIIDYYVQQMVAALSGINALAVQTSTQ